MCDVLLVDFVIFCSVSLQGELDLEEMVNNSILSHGSSVQTISVQTIISAFYRPMQLQKSQSQLMSKAKHDYFSDMNRVGMVISLLSIVVFHIIYIVTCFLFFCTSMSSLRYLILVANPRYFW